MAGKNRTLEESARREKIRELLQMEKNGTMDDIQNLFKETIAECMKNGLEVEVDEEPGYSMYDKEIESSHNGHSSKMLRTGGLFTAALSRSSLPVVASYGYSF